MFKVIFIEDDEKKVEDVVKVLETEFEKEVSLVVKKSYQSGLRGLFNDSYDLLLLDMSLPTWEETHRSSINSFEKFGGYKILSELKRKRKEIPTILITMFDDFGQQENPLTLGQLDSELTKEFSSTYLGHIFYNIRESNWKEELIIKVHEILNESSNR